DHGERVAAHERQQLLPVVLAEGGGYVHGARLYLGRPSVPRLPHRAGRRPHGLAASPVGATLRLALGYPSFPISRHRYPSFPASDVRRRVGPAPWRSRASSHVAGAASGHHSPLPSRTRAQPDAPVATRPGGAPHALSRRAGRSAAHATAQARAAAPAG